MRPVRVLAAEAHFDHRADGTLYVASPRPLGPYPDQLTERLEHWASHAPERIFLAQRDAAGAWRSVTYAEALPRVRAIAQALLNRNLGPHRPVAILSGNSIEHALMALACMYAGVLYAPVSPSYSLASSELATLRYLWQSLAPALVFAAEGELYQRPLATILDRHTELVTVSPPNSLRATSFDELLATSIGPRVDEAHARVTPGTVAKVLFTSGSTGAPKGVITTQRMLCSNQQMLRTVMGFLAEEPPVLCDWLPWNHVFGGIGTNDTLASPGAQLDYYQSLIGKMGQARVDSFARLFVIPQAGHGLTGTPYESKVPIPTTYDKLAVLLEWVEHKSAPARNLAVTAGERSLLLCSYPLHPHYQSGPPSQASSYECKP